jgi:hypothetical protein
LFGSRCKNDKGPVGEMFAGYPVTLTIFGNGGFSFGLAAHL